ncbi:hypothetical protein DFS34DRAFT_649003 [Phlyctochytrium arcticum]|nr:hypothetical protein DFS34DRAFT_649003 [Phlyctochytrium arcticum]
MSSSSSKHGMDGKVIGKILHDTHALEKPISWSVLCAALMSANAPEVIPHAVQYMTEELAKSDKERINFLLHGREAIFKAYTVAGTPKAINGLTELRNAAIALCPIAHQEVEERLSNTARVPESFNDVQDWTNRGEELFDQIYGRTAKRLKSILTSLHPDLLPLILSESYGKVLAENSVLELSVTELIMVAALKVQGGAVSRQVESHRRGAAQLGCSSEQIKAAEFIADSVVANINNII